ncbi:M28 family metallopeptidase [Flavicella sediminum]|uniref:M28 family metallopeptidase n=1 Tax=Flavicella sediminum TaxID=2585141 RepID=UPI001122F54E|nr:M28 family metallopeptidase [Flavicella sediminum]
MKNTLLLCCICFFLVSCTAYKNKIETPSNTALKYANTITLEELKENLYILASDAYEGRDTGEPGQKKAAQFLKTAYIESGLASPIAPTDYFQTIPKSFLPAGIKASENVLAFVQGSEFPDEIIVLSAHYDHIGTKGDRIFNGADDDASGTVAILEIAEAFQLAANAGQGPKRSLLFLNLTAEEKGLYGSKWYVKNPIFPLKNHVANLNIDMIGRVDDAHKQNPNYIYLIGSDKLSTELHQVSEMVNKEFLNLNLDYTFNAKNEPNRFYYRSDHYNFAKNNIPVIFYFNGVHEDYHKASDTADKINYELLTQRTKLVFHTAWEIANRKTRLVVDK